MTTRIQSRVQMCVVDRGATPEWEHAIPDLGKARLQGGSSCRNKSGNKRVPFWRCQLSLEDWPKGSCHASHWQGSQVWYDFSENAGALEFHGNGIACKRSRRRRAEAGCRLISGGGRWNTPSPNDIVVPEHCNDVSPLSDDSYRFETVWLS